MTDIYWNWSRLGALACTHGDVVVIWHVTHVLRTHMGQVIAFFVVTIIIITRFTFRRQLEDAFDSVLNCERPPQSLQHREGSVFVAWLKVTATIRSSQQL